MFDSSALIAFLEDQPGGEMVEDLIAGALEQSGALMMSAVNAGEIWYITARRHSERDADKAVGVLGELGVSVSSITWQGARQAAVLKAQYRIPYADAFAAALTLDQRGILVTADKDFRVMEAQLPIRWIH